MTVALSAISTVVMKSLTSIDPSLVSLLVPSLLPVQVEVPVALVAPAAPCSGPGCKLTMVTYTYHHLVLLVVTPLVEYQETAEVQEVLDDELLVLGALEVVPVAAAVDLECRCRCRRHRTVLESMVSSKGSTAGSNQDELHLLESSPVPQSGRPVENTCLHDCLLKPTMSDFLV